MENNTKTYLPVTLDLSNKTILLIGGGVSAFKKLRILQRFTQEIIVLAENPNSEIKNNVAQLIVDTYNPKYLKNIHLVYASTDNLDLDRQIKNDCNQRGILVNVHDRPEMCDFVSPAIYQNGNITVSVGSNATDAFKSIELRDKIKDFLEREYFDQKEQNNKINNTK